MSERCEWSDLRVEHCAHCGASPGSRPTLEPPRALVRREVVATEDSTLERPKLPDTWGPSNDAGECRCGQPTQDEAWLCPTCEDRFLGTLADLPALDEELSVTITRQRAAGAAGTPRGATNSLPWHETASDARRALHGLLVSWVRFCTEENVRGKRMDDPVDRIDSLATWLASRVHGLALLDIGPEAMDEITDAAAECHRIVFWKRRNRVYLGPCGVTREQPNPDTGFIGGTEDPCPGEVYAEEGEPVGYCDLCGDGATVAVKRSAMEKDLDSRLYTAAEIARLSTYLGLDVPREQVRRRVLYWHRHKLVEQRSTNLEGLPLFRYGEVRGRLYADFAKRAS